MLLPFKCNQSDEAVLVNFRCNAICMRSHAELKSNINISYYVVYMLVIYFIRSYKVFALKFICVNKLQRQIEGSCKMTGLLWAHFIRILDRKNYIFFQTVWKTVKMQCLKDENVWWHSLLLKVRITLSLYCKFYNIFFINYLIKHDLCVCYFIRKRRLMALKWTTGMIF